MKEIAKWLIALAIVAVATPALVLVLGDSNYLPLLPFFGLKLIGCVVVALCAMAIIELHRSGNLPALWYKYFKYCKEGEE